MEERFMTFQNSNEEIVGGIPLFDEQVPCAIIKSEKLFHGGREVVIAHDAQLYHLRITRTGKLILTK